MRGGPVGGSFLFMNALQVFSYNGSNVTFSNENGMWVNATEMAKPFDKFPYDWLRLQSSKDFLLVLVSIRGLNYEDKGINYEDSSQFIKTIEGRNGGTWFHEDVAIEFARWLSPAFAIWCNDRIKEILTGTMAKYPMTSDEAIAYGYGKALEKINRQSTIIARQSKQLQKYKSQLEVEKEKKEKKRIAFAQTLTDDVKDWILTIGVTGVIKLSTLHQKYHDWCTDNGRNYITIRQLAAQLRILGYASIHKCNGTWFII